MNQAFVPLYHNYIENCEYAINKIKVHCEDTKTALSQKSSHLPNCSTNRVCRDSEFEGQLYKIITAGRCKALTGNSGGIII